MLEFISIKDAVKEWGISERRIQKLCGENRTEVVIRFGRSWSIPKDTKKPVDGR